MWNPDFPYVERRFGTVYGYRRRLSVWSSRARGTPEKPGLGLGLELKADDQCKGVVYRVDPKVLEEGLKAIWEREMTTGIYRPYWLPVETEEGDVTAITFVVNREHPQYASELPRHEMVAIIAEARGKYGPCREYLANTVHALAALGVDDPEFNALLSLVNTRA